MLVLSRKKDQSVLIDGGIRVVVVEVTESGKVKLGFVAPRGCSIVRDDAKRQDAQPDGPQKRHRRKRL